MISQHSLGENSMANESRPRRRMIANLCQYMSRFLAKSLVGLTLETLRLERAGLTPKHSVRYLAREPETHHSGHILTQARKRPIERGIDLYFLPDA